MIISKKSLKSEPLHGHDDCVMSGENTVLAFFLYRYRKKAKTVFRDSPESRKDANK